MTLNFSDRPRRNPPWPTSDIDAAESPKNYRIDNSNIVKPSSGERNYDEGPRSAKRSYDEGKTKEQSGLTAKETASLQRRLRELDQDRNPPSLAEQISRDRAGSSTPTAKFEKSSSSDNANRSDNSTDDDNASQQNYKLLELQRLSTEDLQQIADHWQLSINAEATKQQLVFSIIREQVRRDGLMFGEGTLEILPDGFGFLRSPQTQYLSCPDDIYVSPSQIRRFNLETGVTVSGQIRPPKENERYFALLRVEAINHFEPNQRRNCKPFETLTPTHPNKPLVMETDASVLETRVVDLMCPIGFGQRGLIVSPPRAGKTILMQKLARAVIANHPEAFLMMLLVDERPEEVTDMQREVSGANCEVIASTFDEPASRHIQVATMVMEKAKRLVEQGVDVIVFLDSITRLARAFNSECPPGGKLLSGGVDASALQKPKSFFGYARKVEQGGSLTILATALIDTGSRMDEVIFEEFKGTGNMEIVLDRKLVDKRIWPAINIQASGTRREEMLIAPEDLQKINLLRRSLQAVAADEAMLRLTTALGKTQTNAEFLAQLKKV